jgi:hypothetical protein
MSDYLSLAIGTGAGFIAFLAITLRMNYRRRLDQARQEQLQPSLPFHQTEPSQRGELVTPR